MAAKTRERIRLTITNSQNMYICDISLFLQYLTHFVHMFIISSISTVTEGASNLLVKRTFMKR